LLVVRVGDLVGEEGAALLELIELADGVEVDVAEALDLLAQLLDLGRDGVPIHVGGLGSRRRLRARRIWREIELSSSCVRCDERFEADAELVFAHLELVDLLFDLAVLAAMESTFGRERLDDSPASASCVVTLRRPAWRASAAARRAGLRRAALPAARVRRRRAGWRRIRRTWRCGRAVVRAPPSPRFGAARAVATRVASPAPGRA
jgi:hypothetical protein